MIFFLDTDNDENMRVVSGDNWRLVKHPVNESYLLIINGILEYELTKQLRDKLIAYLRGSTEVRHIYISKKTVSVDNGL